MKKILFANLFIIPLLIHAQSFDTIQWINDNAIKIEDANPDTDLIEFAQNMPAKFAKAKIYGFGEASHNTKEFFDLKAKFFKYLVKTQGVRTFIMEESYQAESDINTWLSGGNGDIKRIAENFSIGFWRCKEVLDLMQWIKNYNAEKPLEEQIRFYGMDIQVGHSINQKLRSLISKYNIAVEEKLLLTVDSCATKKIDYQIVDNWWKTQIPKLYKLKQQILDAQLVKEVYNPVVRSLNYLINYTEYAAKIKEVYPTSTKLRDLKMFENVKWIIENESDNGKAFVWAHNEHINKKEMYYTRSGIPNLGCHLKDHYKDVYYSIGFDFGNGTIEGYVMDKKKGNYWKTYNIDKPLKKTYAHTLIEADNDIYFIELSSTSNFFAKKSRHLLIGAGGYQPDPLHKILMDKVYSDSYDALIFVKTISPADYNLN